MANEMVWLVTFGEEGYSGEAFGQLEDAIDYMRDHHQDKVILWARSDIALVGPAHEKEPPPQKRPRRARKVSPAPPEQRTQTTPAADAPKAGENQLQPRDLGSAGGPTQRVDAAPAAPPSAPLLSCGGTRCRDNGKTEVHDTADPSCTKVHPRRREAAR